MDEKNTTNAGDKNSYVAIIIIVGILLAGGAYAYFKAQEQQYPEPSQAKILHREKITPENDPVLHAPESTSTNPEDIEKDLDMSGLDTIDKDLNSLDQL